MARGWESKSVESQIESLEPRPAAPARPKLTAAEVDLLRQKESLALSRTHVVNLLGKAENPRYRKILEKTLRELDSRLKTLG
jgi:hypothetical protein